MLAGATGNFRRVVIGSALMTACVVLPSCSTFESSGLPGSAASMARNQIMWVDRASHSFGYYRLQSQRQVYPDLDIFIEEKGEPDFLAETSDDMRRYFIIYYLREREAFACRTEVMRQDSLEFSGPYPITDGEVATLRRLKSGNAATRGWTEGTGP